MAVFNITEHAESFDEPLQDLEDMAKQLQEAVDACLLTDQLSPLCIMRLLAAASAAATGVRMAATAMSDRAIDLFDLVLGVTDGTIQLVSNTQNDVAKEEVKPKEVKPKAKAELPKRVVDDKGNERWLLNGKLHREDGPAVTRYNGATEWYLNGKRHRDDGPAIQPANGSKHWYCNGKRHREDGPAIEFGPVLARKEWYIDGKLHREDGPAIEHANGTKQWYLNGELHREDSPAIEYANGDKEWYLNGKRHREDGPAIEDADGRQEWFLKGRRHRTNGPAVEGLNKANRFFFDLERHAPGAPEHLRALSDKYWFIHGECVTEAQFNVLVRR